MININNNNKKIMTGSPKQTALTDLYNFLNANELPKPIYDFVLEHTSKDGKFLKPNELPELHSCMKRWFTIHTERIGSIREGYHLDVKIESVSSELHQMFLQISLPNCNQSLVWSTGFGMFLVFDNADNFLSDLRRQAYRSLRKTAEDAKDKIVSQMESMLTFVRNQCQENYTEIVEQSTGIQNYGFGFDQ